MRGLLYLGEISYTKDMFKKYYGPVAGILVATALAVGILFFQKDSLLAVFGVSNTATSSNSLVLPNGTTVTSEGGGKVELDTIDGKSVNPPSTNRPITISTSISAEAATALKKDMETVINELNKEPKRVDLWLKLGIDRKAAGDYEGAREAWDYVAVAGPASINFIAYGNLGDLYKSYLKDFAKSEVQYKEAIKLKPDNINFYRGLFELYTTYGYKSGTSAAADLLKEGLKNNPNNPDLLKLQADLKAGK